MTYDYYGSTGDTYGLPGDLKTIVTEQWDAAASVWTGDDTNYFRYYTDTATAHELKRVILPNAYAAFVAAYDNPDERERRRRPTRSPTTPASTTSTTPTAA